MVEASFRRPVSYKFVSTCMGIGVLATLFLAGCGPEPPVLIPAKGTITIGGRPAANISVQFLPDVKEDAPGNYPTSYGISLEDGSFELRTADNLEGAVPGLHKLILVDMDEERPEQGTERTRPIRLPQRYLVAGTATAIVEKDKPIEISIP
ncbi:MAG TPA: hypothetical protein PKD72_16595 [Gemmatales bacterium]|nr:hypothetical protein [Gemmatales bacterium]